MGRYNLRHNATRDLNEKGIVDICTQHGYMVDRLNGKDIPDLLLVRPSETIPIFVVSTDDEAIALCKELRATGINLALVEVKDGHKQLEPGQEKWHADRRVGRATN